MKQLVVAAGMPRSGSTWLYNAARILLESTGKFDIGAGWISDYNTFQHHDLVILKIHFFNQDIANNGTAVLYSYRDIRDALASFKRKFGVAPTIDLARRFLASDRDWRQRSHFIMRYEDMIREEEETILQLAQLFEITGVDAKSISERIKAMNYDTGNQKTPVYNLENLLHKNHITDGRHGSWEGHVPPSLVERIETEFADWLVANGYTLSKVSDSECG